MRNLLERESRGRDKSMLLSYLIGLLGFFVIIQYFDPVTSIVISGNPLDKDRPWRVWSGNPCQPCDIRIPVGGKSFRMGFCQSPCVRDRTNEPGCVRKGDYDFECNCKPDYGGKFCEQPLGRKIRMENAVSSELADIKTQVIPIGAGSDYLFECIYPNGTRVNYESSYIGEYFPDRLNKGQFKCEEKEFQTSSSQRCKYNIDGTTNICLFCRAATNASFSDGLDHYSFSNFVWDIYSGNQCEKVVEIYIVDLKSTKTEKILRDNVNCDLRKNGEEMYRGGCRTTPDASSDSCIQNSHMGHRCKTCDKGVWGNKCQFVIEDEWDGCPDPEFKEHPCGDGGTLVQRPNGKFCICPPGKIDGFYNVFKDRVKDPSCSPAKTDTDDWVTEKNSELYKFFVGMSQFHTYHGCRIEDPCHNFRCANNGKQEIVDLIDEESYGFKETDLSVSRLSALEIADSKFKCICNCPPGFLGVNCEDRDPCHFEDNCQNLGICQRVDNFNKRCECSPPYGGPLCEIVNPCQIQEVCEGSVRKCFPCKHSGICESKADDTEVEDSTAGKSYKFSCNCKSISYVGKLCEFAQGEIEIRVISADPENVIVGSEEVYEIFVRKKGDIPRIIVDMRDGFHFSITEDQLIPGSVTSSSQEPHFYRFSYKFTKEGNYEVRAFITNGDPNPKEDANQIHDENIFLSGKSFKTITAVLPVELKCLPYARLVNVGPTVHESTPYTRKSEFTVESVLEPKCDEIFNFNYSWNLHKLDSSPYPTASPENNFHIEKVVSDVSKKYVTFKPRSLLNGRYVLEYVVFVEINGIKRSNSAKGYFNIELNPPKIVIHGGLDRSVDVSQETVLDATDSLDESFPEKSYLLSISWSCDSPSACDLGGPWNGPVLRLPAATLTVGVEYRFHVDVSFNHDGIHRLTMASIRLIGATGSLHVSCIENCERMNPGDEILLRCICLSCSVPPNIVFSWEPISDGIIPIVKQDKYSVGMRLPNINPGETNLKSVICKTLDTGLVAKLDVRINTPPSGGNCGIEPHEGVYLKTVFNIECEGFTDENIPLEYSFYAGEDPDDLDNLYLLAHDTNPRATNIYLPYNSNGNDITIVVKVTDYYELSTLRILRVTVALPDAAEYPDLLRNLISGSDSLMKKRKKFGDNQGALQLQLVVLHGLLDSQFVGLPQQDMQDLLQAMSNVLSETPLHSFKAVEQTLESLHLLKQVDEEESLERLRENSIVLFSSASRLAEYVLTDDQIIPTQNVQTLARVTTDSARRILKHSNEKGLEIINSQVQHSVNERRLTDFDADDDIARDYFFEIHDLNDVFDTEEDREVQEGLDKMIQEYAKISHHAFTAIEHLLDAVGERLEDGQSFKIKTDDLTVYVDYDRKLNSLGSVLELETSSGKAIKLQMSGDLQKILESQGISNIIIEVIQVLENPFFDDFSAIPGTPVVSAVIKDRGIGGERLPIHLEGLQQPFEFYIPLTSTARDLILKTERSVLLKPLNEISESDLEPIHLILPYNSRIEVTIEDFSIDIEFSVVVSKDFWPTKQDFCDVKKKKILNPANGYSFHFETETLGSNEEPEEHFLEYFVSIFPYQLGVSNDLQQYSVYFTRSSCLFRDENGKFWSEVGCRVGSDTTATILHCICNHASIFSGTQFTVPNDIPTINIFDFNPEEFERNPVVLITVCTLICAYALGLIICTILDRRDQQRHVGITIMADLGDNFDHSYYLITVLTGSRFGAGTTASVSMQMYGSKGRSQIYVLKEKAYPVLNRGGTDTFLVSSLKDLGEFEKIRLWHDNYGSSPNWFCRKVIIQDVKSGTEWYFFLDRWLEVTGTESTIIFERHAASEKEHSKFQRRFRENMTDQLDNSHLWLSLFRRPAASRFTRCQRLSCAFAILTSYMMLNIVFYGIELEDIDDPWGLQKYAYAIQMTLLALPFGLVLVLMFRRIRQRYLPTLIIWRNVKKSTSAEPNGDTSVFVPAKPKVDTSRKGPSQAIRTFGINNPMHMMTGSGDEGDFRDNISEVSSNFSIPSTNIEDLESWLEQQENQHSHRSLITGAHFTRQIPGEKTTSNVEQIAIGRMGLVHAVRAVDPSSFIFQGDGDIPEMEEMIDDQIKSHLTSSGVGSGPSKRSMNSKMLPSQKDFSEEHDETDEIGALLQSMMNKDKEKIIQSSKGNKHFSETGGGLAFETCEMSPVKKAWCYLPWWFIFFAWILCLGIILTCLYITLLYGLHYGYLRSIDWLIGVTSSFILSLFIIQPLNVLISSLGLTLCFRSKKSSEIQEERFQILLKDKDDLGYRKPSNFRVFNPERKHPPLSGHDIFRLKVEARGREKIRNGLLKLLFYAFIMVPLIVLSYAGRSSNDFLIVNNIRRLLHITEIEYGDSGIIISNENELYEYLENVFIPAVHPEVLYNGVRVRPKRFDPIFLDDGQSLLLGVPRIRQVRVQKDDCHIETSIDKPLMNCFRPYSLSTQDTESYNPLWKPVINGDRSKLPTSNDIWKFYSFEPEFVRSLVFDGEMGMYDGGGYVAELGRRYRESSSVIRYLKRSRWIDHRTRAVFIELTIVNPNVNVYTDIKIVIERNPSQEFYASHYITPLVLSSSDDLEVTPWLTVSYGMLMVSLILLIIIFFWNIFKNSDHAFYKPWFWLDLLFICGIVSSLLISIKNHFVVTESLEHIEGMKINQYVNLQLVAFWSQISTAAFSISQCVCFMKIWRVLILIDERFLITSLTIKVTARFLMAYFLVLLIIIIAFASGGHFIFGRELIQFHTFSDSMISLIDQILSVNFFAELATSHRILGPIYSFMFGFFVVFLSLNLLISLLNQGLHEGKQISAERCRRWTYGTYLATAINYIFSWHLFPTEQTERINSRSLQPDRLEMMKKMTASLFMQSLKSSVAQSLREMKNYTNRELQGTGYRVVSKLSKKHQEEVIKESRMDKMRLATGDFLRTKMRTEMSSEEFKDYADVNRAVVQTRVKKLEQKLAAITTAMNRLVK